MSVITTTIHVAADGVITISDKLPEGDYAATLIAAKAPLRPGKPFTMKNFPIDDGPWDDRTSLRREDMYDDDGR